MGVMLFDDEAKLLTMVLVEDRSHVVSTIRKGLAPHGQELFDQLVRRLAKEVLDVDPQQWARDHGQPT